MAIPSDNFYIQRSIPDWGKTTYVNWNRGTPSKALIFVHGFNGSTMDTFGHFNLEFRFRPAYKDYDVYFFSYDSLFQQISNSALEFLHFLRTMHDNPDVIMQSSGMALHRNTYTEIVIAAHSLGAVVTRVALNEGYDSGATWLDKCKLILFAPAHNGARKELDTFINFPGYLKCMGPFLRYFVLSLSQLIDPTIILAPMHEKIKELITKEGIESFTVAKKVIWASPERVVINRKLLKDPEAIIFRKKNHSQVCKPTATYLKPFTELEALL
jgi:pimeloyl-ACP methyl ester carboxylesterase